jgi:hypothetical protein
MPRKGRKKGDRKRESFEWRQRDTEYRALARELHREWCERLDDEDELTDDLASSEQADE